MASANSAEAKPAPKLLTREELEALRVKWGEGRKFPEMGAQK